MKKTRMCADLLTAAYECHPACMVYRIKQNENVNLQNSEGDTALHMVAGGEMSGDIIKLLLKHNAACIKNHDGDTALDVAIRHGIRTSAEILHDAGHKWHIPNHPNWFWGLRQKRKRVYEATQLLMLHLRHRLHIPKDMVATLGKMLWRTRFHANWDL